LSIADFVRLLERSGVWDPQTKRVIQPVELP
jgi:16S rRNA (adenine1518-N6/adenine1519-N6)-dimethyltransferase